MVLTVLLVFWCVVGLSAGDMLVNCAVTMLEEHEDDLNENLMLLFFSIACLIAAPWLLLQACIDLIWR